MNAKASTSSQDQWTQALDANLLTDFDTLHWLPVSHYAAHPPPPFSTLPSISTPIPPGVSQSADLIIFPTLAELLFALVDNTQRRQDTQLTDDQLQIATTWISNRYRSIADIPEHEFDRYTEEWQKIALEENEGSNVTQDGVKRKIPRPCNCFFFFKQVVVGALHSGFAAQIWRSLSRENIKIWEEASERLVKLHKDIFPGYRYQPVHNAAKRKTNIKARTQAKIRKSTLPHGGKERRTPEAPTEQESILMDNYSIFEFPN